MTAPKSYTADNPNPTAPKPLPPVEHVRAVLDYDPATGVLTWKSRPRSDFACSRGWRVWESKCAGNPAGTLSKKGYININIYGGFFRAHRLAWLHYHGEEPKGIVDHNDHNRANNRIENLRDCSNDKNLFNRKGASKNNKSTGMLGVYLSGDKFYAKLHVGPKTHRSPHVASRDTAALYRIAFEVLYHGSFAACQSGKAA